MIIGCFIIDRNENKKIFRSTYPLSSSKINYYQQEFLNSLLSENEAISVIKMESYKYIYMKISKTSKGLNSGIGGISGIDDIYVVILATEDEPTYICNEALDLIYKNYERDDIFDILVYFDNLITNGQFNLIDLEPIRSMESQEEKIYQMMLEQKRSDMKKRDKELTKLKKQEEYINMLKETSLRQNVNNLNKVENSIKKKSIDKIESDKPVLIILKEKVKLVMDKDNFIKENQINGELSMIISDPKYKGVSLHALNLLKHYKYSPYLDKDSQSRGILRFVNKERQINKKIPLLKYTTKLKEPLVKVNVWIDEEDPEDLEDSEYLSGRNNNNNGSGNRYINSISFEGNENKDIKNLEISFSTEELINVEIVDEDLSDYQMKNDKVILYSGDLKSSLGNKSDVGSSVTGGVTGGGVKQKTYEIRNVGFDQNGIFPLSLSFNYEPSISNIKISKVLLNDEEIEDFEFRQVSEIEKYEIIGE